MSLPRSYLNRIMQGLSPASISTVSCLYPRKIKITDSCGIVHDYVVDCGKCFRCGDARRNEMAARMFLHSQNCGDSPSMWKHVYFITLTYGNYNLHEYIKHPFKEDWLKTYPLEHDHNFNHVRQYAPTIILREHIVKYFKRLRQIVDGTISFCYCGEYGSSFSRPHYHAVVWSTVPVSVSQFESAWSLKVSPTKDKKIVNHYRHASQPCEIFSIGNVVVDDLVTDGTMSDRVSSHEASDGKNALHNFMYVAKYLGKTSYMTSHLYEKLKEVFTSFLVDDPDSIDYEMSADDAGFTDPLSKLKVLTLNNVLYEKISFSRFRDLVAPFFGCSTAYAPGKQYALANCTRFASKDFGLPTYRGKKLAFPRYFYYLLAKKEFPLRFVKVTSSGVSLTKGNIQNLYDVFQKFYEDKNVYYSISVHHHVSQIVPPRYSSDGFIKHHCLDSYGSSFDSPVDGIDPLHVSSGVDLNLSIKASVDSLSKYTIFDQIVLTDGSYTYHYRYSPNLDLFLGYTFDRSTRQYVFTEYIERIDFCDYILRLFNKEFDLSSVRSAAYKDSATLFDLVESDPFTPGVRSVFMNKRDEMQRIYHLTHKNNL